VNKTTQRVRSDNSQKPQNKQNNQDCPQHNDPPLQIPPPTRLWWQVQAILFIPVCHSRVSSVLLIHTVKIAHQSAADERRHTLGIKPKIG
jgi:hypothetical protein